MMSPVLGTNWHLMEVSNPSRSSSSLDEIPMQQGSPLAYSVYTNDDVPCYGDTSTFERSITDSYVIVLQSLC